MIFPAPILSRISGNKTWKYSQIGAIIVRREFAEAATTVLLSRDLSTKILGILKGTLLAPYQAPSSAWYHRTRGKRHGTFDEGRLQPHLGWSYPLKSSDADFWQANVMEDCWTMQDIDLHELVWMNFSRFPGFQFT